MLLVLAGTGRCPASEVCIVSASSLSSLSAHQPETAAVSRSGSLPPSNRAARLPLSHRPPFPKLSSQLCTLSLVFTTSCSLSPFACASSFRRFNAVFCSLPLLIRGGLDIAQGVLPSFALAGGFEVVWTSIFSPRWLQWLAALRGGARPRQPEESSRYGAVLPAHS